MDIKTENYSYINKDLAETVSATLPTCFLPFLVISGGLCHPAYKK